MDAIRRLVEHVQRRTKDNAHPVGCPKATSRQQEHIVLAQQSLTKFHIVVVIVLVRQFHHEVERALRVTAVQSGNVPQPTCQRVGLLLQLPTEPDFPRLHLGVVRVVWVVGGIE